MAKRPAKTAVRTKSGEDLGWRKLESLMGIGQATIARVSEAQALCQSAMMSAVDVISQDISKTTLRLYRGRGDNQVEIRHDQHPWARKLALQPNRHHQWRDFSAMAVTHLATSQNAYILRRPRNIADTEPDLVPISSRNVTLNAYAGEFFYDIIAGDEGQAALLGFYSAKFGEDRIIHAKMRHWDGYKGLSTFLTGANVLGLNQLLMDFQAALTKSGTRPGAVITVPESLTDEAFVRLKADITEAYERASGSHKPFLLEQGAKMEKVSFDATEMDLVKARTQIHQEVARLFRMPPYKIGLLESIKAENLAQMEQAYTDDTLIPLCRSLEASLTAALLSEEERLADYRIEYDRHELYNRDPATAAQRVIEAYTKGIITRGQATTRLGYGPVSLDLNTYSLPVNTAILHSDGRVEFVTPNAVPAAASSQEPQDPKV
jgi:HK97 family phage portal protein